jgi:hypothetical protein
MTKQNEEKPAYAKASADREKKTEKKLEEIQRQGEENRAKDLASELGFNYIDLRTAPNELHQLMKQLYY